MVALARPSELTEPVLARRIAERRTYVWRCTMTGRRVTMTKTSVRITIEYEPTQTGTDTPQDVLEEVLLAVKRRGGQVVSAETKGG